MRAGFALFFCLAAIALTGCQSAEPAVLPDEAHVPQGRYVTVPRLADNLRLSYRSQSGGLIELSSPPDHVMLVEESTRVLVNGEALRMEFPCVRRGEDFVLRAVDADRVTAELARLRGARERSRAHALRPRKKPVVIPLTADLRPDAPPRDWRYIVIHHTATAQGSAALIHRSHLARGMDGLGYHFVIGNGTLSGDGEIEVGYRWKRQIHGAHARVRPGDDNRWNEFGIGICLVGDFRYAEPSEAQMDTLVRLVRSLRIAYAIPASSVVPHEFVKPTICPGPRFPWAEFQARIR